MFGWGQKEEPVTRSGHLTSEAREEALKKAEAKREATKRKVRTRLAKLSLEEEVGASARLNKSIESLASSYESTEATMTTYDEENGTDDKEWFKKTVSVPWDTEDLQFWF